MACASRPDDLMKSRCLEANGNQDQVGEMQSEFILSIDNKILQSKETDMLLEYHEEDGRSKVLLCQGKVLDVIKSESCIEIH